MTSLFSGIDTFVPKASLHACPLAVHCGLILQSCSPDVQFHTGLVVFSCYEKETDDNDVDSEMNNRQRGRL